MKRGEDQPDRLASRIAEVLAGVAVDGVLNAVLGRGEQSVADGAGSANQTAAFVLGSLIDGLYPHISGRWQETSIEVGISTPDLSSRTEAAVLNGANVALVETEAGWEMIQNQQAELVDVDTYRLSGLLRGQQGSDEAMLAGAGPGSAVVFLTGAEYRLDVADWERGLELVRRVGRESSVGGEGWTGSFLYQQRAGRPRSPAHFTATESDGDIEMDWVLRARKGG